LSIRDDGKVYTVNLKLELSWWTALPWMTKN
jgi:hypothetical protein